jgi:histidinol dehydrogenase
MKVFNYNEQGGTEKLNGFFQQLKKRDAGNLRDIEDAVKGIIHSVKERGNAAVVEYTNKFDQVYIDPDSLEVSKTELEGAMHSIDKELLKVLEKAYENIRAFHEKQRENSWFMTCNDGTLLGQKVTPLSRVGVYVPAGSAPLPSTVLMNVIPAKVAGVGEVILCSPPGKNGRINSLILACAKLCGVDRVFKAGGAQAIAAMAYGTETIPKVDKITGPGNIYVATAKKLVFGTCGIDMIAGPSEVLIIADQTAKAQFVVADLLSQAEHDPLASAILVTVSEELAYKVRTELEKQLSKLPRRGIARRSLEDYGAVIITNNIKEAIEISNLIAPEHLELCTKEPFSLLSEIKNAGAIFLGSYSSEALGDYFAGPNHTLPTSGTARFFSPLGVYDFIKRQSIISYSQNSFLKAAPYVEAFAKAEELNAHAQAVAIRYKEAKTSAGWKEKCHEPFLE